MTRYAPGTPESVMQAMDEKFYGTKKDKTAPPIDRDKAFAEVQIKPSMVKPGQSMPKSAPSAVSPPAKPPMTGVGTKINSVQTKPLLIQAPPRPLPPKPPKPPKPSPPRPLPPRPPRPTPIVDPRRPAVPTGRPMMKKGGSINLANCKITTAKKNSNSRF